MGLQVSSDLDSEIPEKSIIRRSEKISWRRFQRTGTTKRVQSFRGPPLGGAWFYNRFERFTNNPPALPEVTESIYLTNQYYKVA